MRLFAAVAGAAVLLLAGGSAIADSPADQGTAGSTCLTGVTSVVPVVAPAKGKLSRVLAPVVAKDSIELKNALGTALTCGDQAEKAVEAPAAVVQVPAKLHLTRDGVPHCAVP